MNNSYILWTVKFLWNPTQYKMFGPYCPVCGLDLKVTATYTVFHCDDCLKDYTTPYGKNTIKEEAARRYSGKIISQYQVINLDLPPTKIKLHDEDENYFVTVGLTQKDGRRLLMVLAGEKKGKQTEKDYAQIFLDLDQEQVRYHAANKLPSELFVGFVAEFRGNKSRVDYKSE